MALGTAKSTYDRSVVVWLMTVASLALTPGFAPAQPPFFEPPQGYYGAKGTRVIAEWSSDRSRVREDESLTLTLVVRGASNPQEIVRPDLRSLPKFSSRFQIEDVPGPAPSPDSKEAAFVYRLRPRSRDVDGIPSLDFFYLNPGVAVGSPYMNARVKGIPITVEPAAAKTKPPAIPLDGPQYLFDIATGPALLDEPIVPGAGAWLVLLLAGPVLAAGWWLAWRQVYPDAARLARLRRTRAVRRVTDAIRRAGRTADPAAAIAAAILGYLRARFPLPPEAETPPEVREALISAGLPASTADDVAAFLRRCDEARFAPFRDSATALGPAAGSLVDRLEAVA
jgi:hypothetical protein